MALLDDCGSHMAIRSMVSRERGMSKFEKYVCCIGAYNMP